MGCLRVKDGVLFTVIAPAGFRILAELDRFARSHGYELVITSACDGAHSGLNDPHHRGEAYDVRTKTLTPAQKADLLQGLLTVLRDGSEAIVAADIGYATTLFYAQIEDPGGENEHMHVQLRNGRRYPAPAPAKGPATVAV